MNAIITIIVPAELVKKARQAAKNASPAGKGMFVSSLAIKANAEPTHYISSGAVPIEFKSLFTDADLLAKVGEISKADAQALIKKSVVVDIEEELPRVTMSRLGLVFCEKIQELESESKININTATKDALRSLNGVDAVRAQAIIDRRPWSSVDDLATIQGISADMIAGWNIEV